MSSASRMTTLGRRESAALKAAGTDAKISSARRAFIGNVCGNDVGGGALPPRWLCPMPPRGEGTPPTLNQCGADVGPPAVAAVFFGGWKKIANATAAADAAINGTMNRP